MGPSIISHYSLNLLADKKIQIECQEKKTDANFATIRLCTILGSVIAGSLRIKTKSLSKHRFSFMFMISNLLLYTRPRL